jgi:hypothetical protein
MNGGRGRARDRSIDRAFVAFLVHVPPVEREVARRRVTTDIDRSIVASVGKRNEPNRNEPKRTVGTRAPGRSRQGAKDDGQT